MFAEKPRKLLHNALPAPFQTLKAHTGRAFRYALGRLTTVTRDPVFVLGNQKSGTTVIAAALAHCANLSVTLDIRDLTADRLSRLYKGTTSLSAFVNRYRRSFSRSIIKEPGLTFTFEKLQSAFPKASFLLVVRDPRDNIRSVLDRLDLPGDASSLPLELLEKTNPIWQQVVKNDALGIRANHYIESLAHRWNRAANVYLQHSNQINLARYETFCRDKTSYIKLLTERLSLSVTQSPASVVQTQFQSQGNRTVSWTDFFGIENLTRIEQICAENMSELNYKI